MNKTSKSIKTNNSNKTKSSKSSVSWIDDYLDSLMHARFKTMDTATLTPFNEMQFNPLYSREWLAWLTEIVDAAEEKNLPPSAFSETVGPSALRSQIYKLFLDLKHVRKPKTERLRLANFFKDLLSARAQEDAFVLHGKNVVHSPTEIKKMLGEIRFNAASPETVRGTGRLYSSASHLVNGLYGDIYTDFGIEVYGAYDAGERFGEGAILVIKDLHDLRQPLVWRETRSVPCDVLRIYTVYRGIRFWTEAISCHFFYDGNPAKSLTNWAVEADDAFVDEGKLRGLNAEFEKHAVEQWKRLTALDFEEVKQKGLEQRCYGFRKLRAALGLDWRPPRAMREAVRGKPFGPKGYFVIPKGKAAQLTYWRKVLDPRVDFYPK